MCSSDVYGHATCSSPSGVHTPLVSASLTPTSLPLSRFIDPMQMYRYCATGGDPTLAPPHVKNASLHGTLSEVVYCS
jgi:hypothetical protein